MSKKKGFKAMIGKIHSIKDLSVDDLVKGDSGDTYTVIRSGVDLGVFEKVGETFYFRDNAHKTWVCQCSNIDTGAATIEAAVEFMKY